MTLDFATQIYLDIHQLLKGQASVGADDLQTYVKACKETLEKHFEFQADLNVVNGSQEKLDEPLRMIPEVLDSWLVKDDFGKLQTNDVCITTISYACWNTDYNIVDQCGHSKTNPVLPSFSERI